MNKINVCGYSVALREGDNTARMQRAAAQLESAVAGAKARRDLRGEAPDELQTLLEAALELSGNALLGGEEGTRLRREALEHRTRIFELERALDAKTREVALLKAELDKLNPQTAE